MAGDEKKPAGAEAAKEAPKGDAKLEGTKRPAAKKAAPKPKPEEVISSCQACLIVIASIVTLGAMLGAACALNAEACRSGAAVLLTLVDTAVNTKAGMAAKAAAGIGGAVELTPANFGATTAGKGAFVKFLAPW